MSTPDASTHAAPQEERRAQGEPLIAGEALVSQFPEMDRFPEGVSRAKSVVIVILRDYLNDPDIKTALKGKIARAFVTNDSAPSGHLILANHDEAEKSSQPVFDGKYFFQSYIDGQSTLNPEDVKDTLFAIRREANRLQNTENPKFRKLNDLAALAIFNIQQARKATLG